MITITDCWTARGFSCNDHLIDDSGAVDLIGRSYSTVGAARKAVARKLGWRGSFAYVHAADGKAYRYAHVGDGAWGVQAA